MNALDQTCCPAATSPPFRVLVVDDEPVITSGLKRVLPSEWEVVTAGSAHEALDRLAGETFSVIVTDYDMPGRTGIWLLERLARSHPRLRRILHTGSQPAGVDDHLLRGTFERILHKPTPPDVIIAAIAA